MSKKIEKFEDFPEYLQFIFKELELGEDYLRKPIPWFNGMSVYEAYEAGLEGDIQQLLFYKKEQKKRDSVDIFYLLVKHSKPAKLNGNKEAEEPEHIYKQRMRHVNILERLLKLPEYFQKAFMTIPMNFDNIIEPRAELKGKSVLEGMESGDRKKVREILRSMIWEDAWNRTQLLEMLDEKHFVNEK